MERMIPKTGIYQKLANYRCMVETGKWTYDNNLSVRERMFPPRFALPGSFEFEFGNRWKELYRVERMRREQLDLELKEAREKLEGEMDMAFQEFQAAQLREGVLYFPRVSFYLSILFISRYFLTSFTPVTVTHNYSSYFVVEHREGRGRGLSLT